MKRSIFYIIIVSAAVLTSIKSPATRDRSLHHCLLTDYEPAPAVSQADWDVEDYSIYRGCQTSPANMQSDIFDDQ